jgi:hypothetical protein
MLGRFWRLLALAATLALTTAAGPPASQGEVRLEITSRTLAFDGASFGDAGQYERIAGIVRFTIDPLAPANRTIVDLASTPRDAQGLVPYQTDFLILRPREPERASRVLLFDVVNRGIKTVGLLNGGAIGLTDPIDRGDELLMRQGVTVVWNGWQGDIGGPNLIGARLPVARGEAGPLTGRTSTERIFDSPTGDTIALPYPADTLEQTEASLTVRAVSTAPPQILAPDQWRFVDARTVKLVRPANMDAGAIYRFEYVARDPTVMGLGFAATRDLIAFLRHAPASQGNPLADIARAPCPRNARGGCANPDGGIFASAIAFGASQSGRYLRDFVYQGFNRDRDGRRVFDGVMAVIAGARQTFTNHRFAEPGRFSRQHEDHDVPGFTFPYTYATLRDPVTGRSDGLLRACTTSGTCPLLFHIDTGAEFWQAGASLVGTGGTARDVDFPPNVRAYMIASAAHAAGFTLPACKFPPNPMNTTPVHRALFTAMVNWTLGRAEPPPSRWPRLDRGELVPLESLEFPTVPSLGLAAPMVLNRPIPPAGKPDWPIYVPRVDADGNDLPGVRLPPVAAPTGTLLGWNLRKAGFAEGELCLLAGSYLPFAAERADRGADPRLSLAERYPGPDARATRAAEATAALVRDRLLLEADRAAADTPVNQLNSRTLPPALAPRR